MLTFTKQATPMVNHYDLEPILACLETGGTILLPTDTIWGIGCDATNAAAIDKIRQLTQRPADQPFVLLAASLEMVKDYVHHIHPRVETLLLFHERPLTVIYESGKDLPANACADDGSVAIRIPRDPFCKKLIKAFGKPIIATSARIASEPWPAHFGEISSAVIVGVDYVVKHRTMDKDMSEPSVIARLDENEELVFLRE